MRSIGLTGGIASGKSTVSRYLCQEYGVPILDADKVAHLLAKKEGPLWLAYTERYGAKILRSDGSLNRVAIGEIVFHNPQEKNWMDQMAHPLIEKRLIQEIKKAEEANKNVIVLDIPLLFEAGLERLATETWVVYVDEATQLARLMQRNSFSEMIAKERIASQMPLEEKKRRADVVIDNSGTLEETLHQVRCAFLQSLLP